MKGIKLSQASFFKVVPVAILAFLVLVSLGGCGMPASFEEKYAYAMRHAKAGNFDTSLQQLQDLRNSVSDKEMLKKVLDAELSVSIAKRQHQKFEDAVQAAYGYIEGKKFEEAHKMLLEVLDQTYTSEHRERIRHLIEETNRRWKIAIDAELASSSPAK
jgi:hypothetical protein